MQITFVQIKIFGKIADFSESISCVMSSRDKCDWNNTMSAIVSQNSSLFSLCDFAGRHQRAATSDFRFVVFDSDSGQLEFSPES